MCFFFYNSPIGVTLFDDFGKSFEDELNNFQQEDVYVIICAARGGRYEGNTKFVKYFSFLTLRTIV